MSSQARHYRLKKYASLPTHDVRSDNEVALVVGSNGHPYIEDHDGTLHPLAFECEYAGYFASSSIGGSQAQFVSQDLDWWQLQKGIELLGGWDNTGDYVNNPHVKKDGIYTWTFHPRYIIGNYAGPPNPYPPAGALRDYSAWFELQLSTITSPLYADCSVVLPLTTMHGDTSLVYPQTTTCIRIPMRSGDVLYTPSCQHDIPDSSPYAAARRGSDMEVHLIWEPIWKPFPHVGTPDF